MRITSIELQNFRQYQNLKLEFPKTTSNDLHIIVADNGVGKTNILNAITWCLYSDEPHLGNSSKSLPRLNLKAKRDTETAGKTEASIVVKILAEDDGDIIQYQRKQTINISPDIFEFKPEFKVTVASASQADAKIYSNEDAEAYVEKYMPRKIRQYFYFDGEQLDSYFISDESAKIRETIHAISQVDVVTRVKERLQKIVLAKQYEAGKKAPNIQAINQKMKHLDEEIKNIKDQITTIEDQIDKSNKIIAENSEHLSGQENLPDLEAQFQLLNARRTDLIEKRKHCIENMLYFVREMKIGFSLYAAAHNTLEIIKEKEMQNALPPNIDKELLKNILNQHKCLICGRLLDKEDEVHINDIIKQIQVSSETSNLLMLIRNKLEDTVLAVKKYKTQKDKLMEELKETEVDLDRCEQNLQDVDNQISKFSDKAQVVQWHLERKTHQELLKTNQGKLSILKYCLEDTTKQRETAEIEMNNELSKDKEYERIKQLVQFLKKAHDIVSKIECEMMSDVKDKMQSRTMQFFSDLIWKKGVYDHITLDSKYQLDLIHRDGYSCVGSCSAAERSLLALSFTLALHEVSGFNALLFIDTPVARVTSQNRVNFANVLQKVSTEKQLIMAFTPDEYSESIRKVFAPAASSAVHLSMNSENEITDKI